MSQLPTRLPQPRSQALLSRILDQPDLVNSVRKLDPRVFTKLIHHIGLEDSGELVALATTEQLRKIFDDDLWRSERPGRDESFDADRFALWLEVMLEVGEEFAAQKLSELSEDLVTLALNRHILVIDLDELAVKLADRRDDESEQLEKDLGNALSHEFERYQVISRREEGWDSILAVLVALDSKHHDLLVRILERSCHASTALCEENGGLHNVLSGEEMLESDAAAEREERRAAAGYVAPSSATSFLQLARTTELRELEHMTTQDPLTRAYFRNYRPDEEAPRSSRKSATAATSAEVHTTASGVDKLLRLLETAEVLEPARTTPLLPAGTASDIDDQQLIKRALQSLFEHDAQLHSRRMQELSYLANVLVAGASCGGKSFRPLDAAQAVLAVCNLGGERLSQTTPIAELLVRHGADKLFRIGWHLLHRDVVMEAGRTLLRVLKQHLPKISDRGDAAWLGRLERDTQRALTAQKPWTVRGKLDANAIDPLIGESARVKLQNLIDECPRFPTENFISTMQTLAAARRLLTEL